jgi:hypothetical protein
MILNRHLSFAKVCIPFNNQGLKFGIRIDVIKFTLIKLKIKEKFK